MDQEDKRSGWSEIDAAWEEVTPPPVERAGPALTADEPVPPDPGPAAEEVPDDEDVAAAAAADTAEEAAEDEDEEYFSGDDTMQDVAGRTVSYDEQSVPQEVAEFLEEGQPVEVVVPAPEPAEPPEGQPQEEPPQEEPPQEEPQFQPVVDDLLGKPKRPPTFELVPVDEVYHEEERYAGPQAKPSAGPPTAYGSAWVLIALALLTALCIAGVVYVGFCS